MTSGESSSYGTKVALLAAIVPAVAPVIFIAYYSGGDLNVGLAIARSISIPNLLLGLSLAFVPTALSVLAFVLCGRLFLPSRSEGIRFLDRLESEVMRIRPVSSAVLAVVATLLLFMWPAPFAKFVGVCTLIQMIGSVGVSRRSRRAAKVAAGSGSPLPDNVLTVQRTIFHSLWFTLPLCLLAFLAGSWIPLERVRVNDAVIIGHVLQVDDTSTSVLVHSGDVRIISNGAVNERVLCPKAKWNELITPCRP